MKILPVAGTLYVTQGNLDFKKMYEASFPDTEQGAKEAFQWAKIIALGWHETQNEDWNKWVSRHAA